MTFIVTGKNAKKSLIALAFGTLGLGIAEFTMMGSFTLCSPRLWVLVFQWLVILFLHMHWVSAVVLRC